MPDEVRRSQLPELQGHTVVSPVTSVLKPWVPRRSHMHFLTAGLSFSLLDQYFKTIFFSVKIPHNVHNYLNRVLVF